MRVLGSKLDQFCIGKSSKGDVELKCREREREGDVCENLFGERKNIVVLCLYYAAILNLVVLILM